MPGAVGLDRFVPRLLTRWLSESTPPSRWRQVDGTIVSADLSGFTNMSERLAELGKRGAEELTNTINACFTHLIGAAAEEGGDVLKFGGDALLLWYDATHGDDHAERAVRAACRMQQLVAGRHLRKHKLRLSVGARSGLCDLFLVGDSHLELIVCGPAATEVARLESAADPNTILVSASTASALPAGWTDGGGVVDQSAVPTEQTLTAVMDEVPAVDIAPLVPQGFVREVAALAALGGEHRLAAICFVELDGVDERLAALGPEEFADELESVVATTQQLVARYGATMLASDIVADGVKLILTSGVPVSTGQDEESMLRVATDLSGSAHGSRLRIGVNRGRVFAGFLGSPDRQTYTVMGDPVNLSARLMARARPGEVLASDAVVSRARSEFTLAPVPPLLVKGKAEPIQAHLVGPRTTARRPRRKTVELPLVGREAELALLDDAIDAASRGTGRVVEIVGDAGVGKTKLLSAVVDDPRFLVRIAIECQPYDVLTPYAGARHLLRAALGIRDTATPAEAGQTLADRVRRAAPDLVELLPLLAVPVGAEVDDTPEADAIAAEFRPARIHAATVDLLAALLTPVTLLVVEDVYYIDEASLQLLRVLADRVPEHPWCLIPTRRPDGAGVVVGEADGTLLKLAPLDPAQASRLAELAIGDQVIGGGEVSTLVERSGGNPLFVLKLLEATRSGVAVDELPESVERVIAVRIDSLDPGPRAVLRQSAVVGRVFSVDAVDALLASAGLDPAGAELFDDMHEFVERADDAGTYRFRHALIRDAAYEGLPYALRRDLHGRMGSLLESGVVGEATPSLLSLHFWLGGDAVKAWRYSVEAGAAAWRSYAIAESIACYRRGLDVRRRLKEVRSDQIAAVAESLGDALERAARYDDAEEAFKLARRLIGSDEPAHRQARLMRKVGEISERRGTYGQALRWYGRAIPLVEGSPVAEDTAALAELELAYAGVMYHQGRHGELVRWAHRAAASAEQAGDRRSLAHALSLLQLGISHGGGAPSTANGERALALFVELGDVQQQGKILNNLGIEHYYRGRWDQARACYQQAGDCFRRAGDAVEAATALNNLGEILADQGEYDRAEALFDDARRTWTMSRYPLGLGVATSNLGKVAGRQGRLADATQRLAEAEDLFDTLGAAAFVAETRVRRAEALVCAGETRRALAELDDVDTALAGGEPFSATVVGARRVRGWALLQLGEFPAAKEAFLAAARIASRDSNAFEEAFALHGLSELARVSRDPHGPAYEAEAARTFERVGVTRVPSIPLPF